MEVRFAGSHSESGLSPTSNKADGAEGSRVIVVAHSSH